MGHSACEYYYVIAFFLFAGNTANYRYMAPYNPFSYSGLTNMRLRTRSISCGGSMQDEFGPADNVNRPTIVV